MHTPRVERCGHSMDGKLLRKQKIVLEAISAASRAPYFGLDVRNVPPLAGSSS